MNETPAYGLWGLVFINSVIFIAFAFTLAMFPVLVWMYVRLARTEEREARAAFGDAYDRYAAKTPAWFPPLSVPAQTQN
jgi:methanethiol S-methyltransferase